MKDVILEIKSLKKTFIKDRKKLCAVDNIDISIFSGECFGLIGESGSGKSTLANLVAGFISADEGSIRFLGNELSAKSREQRKDMQMIFQDPVMSFSPKMKVIDGVMEGLRYYSKISKSEQRDKALSVLEAVGLSSEFAERKCWQLSGGQCQRAAIARAIIINPKLLICDEVTSALDASIQMQIIELLSRFREEYNMSYLFISHNIGTVNQICDRVAVMYKGRIVEMGHTKEIINAPAHPYTKLLLKSILAVNRETMNKRFEISVDNGLGDYAGCAFANKCSLYNSNCDGDTKQYISDTHWVTCSNCNLK